MALLQTMIVLLWSAFLMGMLQSYESDGSEIKFGLYAILSGSTAAFCWAMEGVLSALAVVVVYGFMAVQSRRIVKYKRMGASER